MAPQASMRERLRRVSEAREALQRRVREAREGTGDDFDGESSGDTIVLLGDDSHHAEQGVPTALRGAAAWSWRFLAVTAAVVVLCFGLWQVKLIVFPVIAALLLAALLYPAVQVLRRWHLPRALAAAIVFLVGLAAVVGVFTFLTQVLADQLGDVSDNLQDGINEVRGWLSTGPLDLSESQIDGYISDITEAVSENRGLLAGGALATATAALEILTGMLLALFATYFFLYDGERIWRWCAKLFPAAAERPVLEAGKRAWRVLISYVRATVVIAAVDAVGIGLVLAFTGIELWVPLAVLVFFGAFVPIVGATVTGAVAVLVALVTNGGFAALVVLAGVIGIQQLEGHILQPLIMGRFVRVHPLAVVLSVGVGGLVAGIWGTIIAVPLAAVVNTVLSYFASLHRTTIAAEQVPPPPDGVERVPPVEVAPDAGAPPAPS